MTATARRVLSQPVQLADIRDLEAFCRRILDRGLPNGMYLRPDEYEDELSELFAECYRLHGRYDPDRTESFSLFARFRLTTYYVPDLCRRLLGRNGGRIAERSHSELDDRAESGRRPWEVAAPEQDGLRADLAADARRETARGDRARARGAALLGLRPAR